MNRTGLPIIVAVAAAALAIGQESRPATTTRPAPTVAEPTDRRTAAVKAIKALEDSMKAAYHTETIYPDRSAPRKKQKVKVADPAKILDCYLYGDELATFYADVLTADAKLAKRVDAKRSEALSVVRANVGGEWGLPPARWVYDGPPTASFSGGHMESYGQAPWIQKPLNKAATELAYSKQNPAGQPIAFSGKVNGTSTLGSKTLAAVLIERTNIIIYVPVPAGKRWVEGVNIIVIGRVATDDATRKAFGLPPEPILVATASATG